MLGHKTGTFTLTLFCSSVALAQAPSTPPAGGPATPPGTTPPGAANPELDRAVGEWINSRVSFARDMYDLNNEETKKFVEMISALVPAEKEYQSHYGVTLRSQKAALGASKNEQVDNKVRSEVTNNLIRQISEMEAKAPMSYANVLKKLEATLPESRVTAAHKKMKDRFASKLEPGQTEVKLETIDSLIEPPPAPPALPGTPNPRPTPPMPGHPTPPTPPGTPTPAVPVPPPSPAPPIDQWEKYLDKATAKFNFADDQKTKAANIVKQTLERAKALKEPGKGDAADPKKANESIDRAYYQMTQRIDSLATLEQKQKAEAAEKKAAGGDAKAGEAKPGAAKPETPHAHEH